MASIEILTIDKICNALTDAVEFVRSSNYNPPTNNTSDIDLGYNDALLEILVQVLGDSDGSGLTIIDLCSGDGKNTLRIAEKYPNAKVTGYEINPLDNDYSNLYAAGNHLVKFVVADIYEMNHYEADIVTFYGACGELSDKIIEQAIDGRTPIIAGFTCCFDMLAPSFSHIQDEKNAKYEEAKWEVMKYMKKEGLLNYIKPATVKPPRLLSRFASQKLHLNDKELRHIASLALDNTEACDIIKLNRMLRLAENDYQVGFDNENSILIAAKNGHPSNFPPRHTFTYTISGLNSIS